MNNHNLDNIQRTKYTIIYYFGVSLNQILLIKCMIIRFRQPRLIDPYLEVL